MALLTRGVSATTPSSPKALQRFQNCIAFLWPSLQQQSQQEVQRKSIQMDAIDSFTSELVHRKTKKWEELRNGLMKKKDTTVSTTNSNNNMASSTAAVTSAHNTSFSQSVGIMSKGLKADLQAIRSPQLGLDIRSLSQAQIDNLLLSTVEIKNKLDFLYLIRQCIRYKQLPSSETLVACLKYLSSLCRLQQIESFAEICRSQKNPLAKIYSDFAPFKAMALWRSGGADVALMTLHRGYGECSETEEGRRMIRNAFRTIVEETLVQKSEAVLVSLMEVARAIYTEYKDIFIVACVWKQCFVSDWFCDQKSAADLFEHYTELQQLVARRSSSLSTSFLRSNNVDAVHRLIEVFLQYNQREACGNCLSLLFNYQYLRSDLRACAEIVKSCSELEMPLSELQNEQFLSLFLNQPGTHEAVAKPALRKLKTPIKEFQYKF